MGYSEILPLYSITLTILLALVLDSVLGEAKRYHYLVGFGWLCQKLELRFNPDHHRKESSLFSIKSALLGMCCWSLLVTPLPLTYFLFFNQLIWYWQIILDGTILYLALGLNSLHKHAMQVYHPLKSGDLATARHFTGYLVSRETQTLSENAMSRATIESMLENGHDAVIASLVYYLIGGTPLVIAHRFANTLDALWGYKNSRYYSFGYSSARLDDLLGFITAKCCTLLYALQGRFLASLKNAYHQGSQYKSHNGGWVMAAGATIMKRTLGGAAYYEGVKVNSVVLGIGKKVTTDDIPQSLQVVRSAVLILITLCFFWETLLYLQFF